jgi:hypothetical protein
MKVAFLGRGLRPRAPGIYRFAASILQASGVAARLCQHLSRRSGRIPAEPYPPLRPDQYTERHPTTNTFFLPAKWPTRYNYPCLELAPLAGFEVIIYGRFSGVH